MAYSTGSGDYVALWAAILAHALGDGWTEAGGLGTGFPITSPGGNTHFDYTTYTATENNLTVGAGGGTLTSRYARLGIGSSAANATTDASTTNTRVPNMHWTFSAWHIFSEPAVSDHIHVVMEFSNGPNADCYQSFSFGELDKNGLTYQGISFATAHFTRGWAASTANGTTNALDWNWGSPRIPFGYTGGIGESGYISATTGYNISFMTQSTNAPHPSGSGGWPAHDTVIQGGVNLWEKSAWSTTIEDPDAYFSDTSSVNIFRAITHDALVATVPSQTGTVSLMPLMFLMINGTGTGAVLRYMGVFPNVRKCSVKDVNPGDEITYGAETWKIFPVLRKTDPSQASQNGVVSSGWAGMAFKKVI